MTNNSSFNHLLLIYKPDRIQHSRGALTNSDFIANDRWRHMATDIGFCNMDQSVVLNICLWANSDLVHITCHRKKLQLHNQQGRHDLNKSSLHQHSVFHAWPDRKVDAHGEPHAHLNPMSSLQSKDQRPVATYTQITHLLQPKTWERKMYSKNTELDERFTSKNTAIPNGRLLSNLHIANYRSTRSYKCRFLDHRCFIK